VGFTCYICNEDHASGFLNDPADRLNPVPIYFYLMDMASFKESIRANAVPGPASVYLKALWYDAAGDWEKAHQLIQDLTDKNAAWIHAYLHRKEGDVWNADWWYNKAGKQRPAVSLEDEWESLAAAFL
jgi:hypothetical protein